MDILQIVVSFIYINKTVFRLKIMAWQTIIVPLLSIGSLFLLFQGIRVFFLDAIFQSNIILGIIICFIAIALLLMLFYFPLTALLGGWDDNSIRDLKNATKMSGISRLIVLPMTFLVFKIASLSPLHNRFKLDEKEAMIEIEELIRIRDSHILEKKA